MGNQFDDAEREVLAENTAQSILKHLNRLEAKRSLLGARWIWELLQNARDAALPTGVNVSVQLSKGELRFRHDGRAFKYKELAHLIYHGTTKLDGEDEVGHFGSGFVSTHLLARRVRVLGLVEDGKQFEFWLDRSSTDQHELAAAMRRSMDECKQSCQLDHAADARTETEFVYPLTAEGQALATTAIEDLKAWGPLVLALAPEISAVGFHGDGGPWRLVRGSSRPLATGLDLTTIEHHTDDGVVPHTVAVARPDAGVQAAIPLRTLGAGLGVELDERTPRVFVLFPLLGTDKLSLPAVLQSREFEPFEDRDGIWLDSDSPRAAKNREIAERALPAIGLLIETAAREKWADTDRLMAFDTSKRPQWVDESWLNRLLINVLERVKDVALIPTVSGDWVPAAKAWLPVTDDPMHQATLWQLAHGWTDSASRLPPRKSFVAWSRNLSNWALLTTRPLGEHPAAFTLPRLARMVSDAGTTENLASKVEESEGVMSWLSRFLVLVQLSRQTSLHDDLSLLPSQTGRLRKRRELAVDQGISDILKDIGAVFGIDIRSGLLDPGVAVPGLETLLPAKSEEQAVDEILAALRRECQSGRIPNSMVSASVSLFWWLADRPQFAKRLEGFPVATTDGGEETHLVVELPRHDQREDRMLAPVAVWSDGARKYVALFPKRKVLHPDFAAEAEERGRWTQLQERGFVHLEPLYETTVRMEDTLTVEPLSDEKEHDSEQALSVSYIACLMDKDVGLINAARKSRARAIQLIEFILNYVLQNDRDAFQHTPVRCECTLEHHVFRAAWLVPLRALRWIPPEADGHGSELASAESLARLLAGSPGLVRQFETESGRGLLQALGISPADLALRVVAPDEETRVSLIRSVGDLAQAAGGVKGVRELVNDIQNDPEILKSISQRKENRERVRRNQGIGQLVEQLLRDQLKAQGLSVERTGTGSDFEVESDFVENGQEVVLRLGIEGASTLLEVKSARGDRVKMTPRQAETACEAKDGFALCVVPITDDAPTAEVIRQQSRFVFAVGSQLAEAWAAYQDIEAATDAALQPGGQVELEIIEGQVRFKVGREVWARGLGFDAAVAEIVKRSNSARVGTPTPTGQGPREQPSC
ncbi:MAG: hypothetical protein IT435_17515 [Phycisphaerales bacterium]|nr:hypothetical protein [Phycisphaerales bacterium]